MSIIVPGKNGRAAKKPMKGPTNIKPNPTKIRIIIRLITG
jgi:hypothetical protein